MKNLQIKGMLNCIDLEPTVIYVQILFNQDTLPLDLPEESTNLQHNCDTIPHIIFLRVFPNLPH